jgi:hypothetical protein
MYKIQITLNKKSKTVLVSKDVENIRFHLRVQVPKLEKINIKDIEKQLDIEINREFLLS